MRQEIATRKLIVMQECIEKNDRSGFLEQLEGHQLHNCIVGDSYFQEKTVAVLKAALEKFIG